MPHARERNEPPLCHSALVVVVFSEAMFPAYGFRKPPSRGSEAGILPSKLPRRGQGPPSAQGAEEDRKLTGKQI